MMTLFNREQVLEAYIEDERRQAANAAAIATANAKDIEHARQMKALGISDDMIASIISKPVTVIQGWFAAAAN